MSMTGTLVSDDAYSSITMPTGRLADIMKNLETKQPSVINLDAVLPPGNQQCFETILSKIGPSVKTLSLRFNDIGEEGAVYLAEWISTNDSLEVLYMMGTNISAQSRQAIETAFQKNLKGHSTNNMGYTFLRISPTSALSIPAPSEN